MTYTHLVSTCVAGAALAALLASATLAHAQGISGPLAGGGFSPPVKSNDAPAAPKLPPPPALPGTASTGEAAPAEKLPSDLPPTDALFDSINRGDIASARDALSRGADLSGTNVLGMTPLELSVDLARNDITFLLLSRRGPDFEPAASGTGGHQDDGHQDGERQTRQDCFARSHAAAPGTTALAASMRARALPAPPAPMAPASVRYAGSDPGTAIPQAGFLGFGGGIAQP